MILAITRCPHCQASFRVTENQLLIADGAVRCGNCLQVFLAEDYFVAPMLDVTERLAIEADYWADFEQYVIQVRPTATAPEQQAMESDLMADFLAYVISHPGATASDEMHPLAIPEEPLASLSSEASSPEDGLLPAPFDLDIEDETMAEVDGDYQPPSMTASLRWLPAVLLMVVIGILQFTYFNIDRYAQYPDYRDWYLKGCRILGCEVPDYDNPAELVTRELIIRSHPTVPDALIADVLLNNAGQFRQQFPGLRLQFFDINGSLVASRVFQVDEYLGGELRGLRYIPARTEVRISLEFEDPGDAALGYQIDAVRR